MAAKLAPQRTLGKTGIKVPLIGYGTSPLGKPDKVPPKEAVRLINHAIDQGITYIDTSPDYGSGASIAGRCSGAYCPSPCSSTTASNPLPTA